MGELYGFFFTIYRWSSQILSAFLDNVQLMLDNPAAWWYTYPSEKYESVGIIIPNIRKNEECSKPPTSLYIVDWLMGYGKERI